MSPGKEHHITVTEHDDAVDALFAIAQAIRLLEDTRDRMVREAREAGVPWRSIGVALGITTQGAQQRYARTIPDPHQMTLPETDA